MIKYLLNMRFHMLMRRRLEFGRRRRRWIL